MVGMWAGLQKRWVNELSFCVAVVRRGSVIAGPIAVVIVGEGDTGGGGPRRRGRVTGGAGT